LHPSFLKCQVFCTKYLTNLPAFLPLHYESGGENRKANRKNAGWYHL
jgi:hypothetical protein